MAVTARAGYSPTWIYSLVWRHNAARAAGRAAGGIASRACPAQDGGGWAGPEVAAFTAGRRGRAIGPQLGRAYLRRLGFTPQAFSKAAAVAV